MTERLTRVLSPDRKIRTLIKHITDYHIWVTIFLHPVSYHQPQGPSIRVRRGRSGVKGVTIYQTFMPD
jgi:hypothetical protein